MSYAGFPVLNQATSPHQHKNEHIERLSPLLEDDPTSFDLLAPGPSTMRHRTFELESRAEALFSKEHLEVIFGDPKLLAHFSKFISSSRPHSVATLCYYLNGRKALQAIKYANDIADLLEPLEGHDFTYSPPRVTVNVILENKVARAFETMVREDLPAYISHMFVEIVGANIKRRIAGNLPPLIQDDSEALAEVFCLTDPSQYDNPIIFASEGTLVAPIELFCLLICVRVPQRNSIR